MEGFYIFSGWFLHANIVFSTQNNARNNFFLGHFAKKIYFEVKNALFWIKWPILAGSTCVLVVTKSVIVETSAFEVIPGSFRRWGARIRVNFGCAKFIKIKFWHNKIFKKPWFFVKNPSMIWHRKEVFQEDIFIAFWWWSLVHYFHVVDQ